MFRNFGIEIEFINTNRDKLVREMQAEGLECYFEGYTHRRTSHWKIVTDASVSNGYELVSPILNGEDGLLDIKKATRAIQRARRNQDMDSVNRSCGLHVHLCADNLTSKDLGWIVKRYKDNEENIDKFFPLSRRGNAYYCNSIDRTWQKIDELVNKHETELSRYFYSYNYSRFSKVNFSKAFQTHRTIEFRQHSGTIDYNKIANWIEFLQNFVEQSIKCKQQGGIDPNYKPNKPSAMFSSIREQVARLGGKLFYQGCWKIIDENGQTQIIQDNSGQHRNCGYVPLSKLYEVEGYKGKLNKERFTAFMRTHFARTIENSDSDPSLWAGQPECVKEFFKMRTAQLERSA